MRSIARIVEEGFRVVLLDDLAEVHEDHPVGDRFGEAHFVGHAEHGYALLGQFDHDIEHFLDHLGIKGRGRLVEQHDRRIHAQRPRDRHPLLLTAGKLSGILVRLLGDVHPLEIAHGDGLGLLARHLAYPDRGKGQVLEDGQVREQVEVLEHHADLAADALDVAQVAGQFGAVDHDASALVFLQPVDATDQGRLARSRRAADDDAFALADFEVDVLQHMEVAEPLVDAFQADDDIGTGSVCVGFHGGS